MGSDTDAGYNDKDRSELADDGAASGFKELLLAMPDVGEDADFARHLDMPREWDASLEE